MITILATSENGQPALWLEEQDDVLFVCDPTGKQGGVTIDEAYQIAVDWTAGLMEIGV